MTRSRLLTLATSLAAGLIAIASYKGSGTHASPPDPGIRPTEAAAASVFIHVASGANTILNYTDISHTATNGKPNAILLVTPNWSVNEVYDDAPIGVWYHGGKWSIFNQDHSSMPLGAAFNVRVLSPGRSAFRHNATRGNINFNLTVIDSRVTNRKAGKILHVTPNWEPKHVYDNHAIGVWYWASRRKWTVYNQDEAPMPRKAAFNVEVRGANASNFVHVASSGNTGFESTFIDSALTNGNPGAMLIVTPNYGPYSVYADRPIGVWYSTYHGKWAVYNQDESFMTVGAAFNVSVY